MAERRWTIGLGCLNLAASALVASLTLSVSTRQNDLLVEETSQNGQVKTLIDVTASLGAGMDSVATRVPEQAKTLARP